MKCWPICLRALAWAFLLGLTACGGDDSSSSSADPAVTSESNPTNEAAIIGTVRAPGTQFSDADTNDSLSSSAENDDLDTAQPIAIPSISNGYLSNVGPQDAVDYYLADFQAGDTVRVRWPVGSVGRPSLSLVDANGVIVATGAATEDYSAQSHQQIMTSPDDGRYFVELSLAPSATALTYSLYLLRDAASMANAGQRGFRPNEAIVKTRDLAGLSRLAALLDIPLTDLGDGATTLLNWQKDGTEAALRTWLNLSPPSATDSELQKTLEVIEALRQLPATVFAHPNAILLATATPNDPLYSNQWGYEHINIPAAQEIEQGQPSVLVAVIDSGALVPGANERVGHPDLVDSLDPSDPDGFDFISDSSKSGDGDGLDDDAYDPGSINANFHGTHVAGTVAAATNNLLGVAGAAPGSRLMILRVLNADGEGSLFDAVAAMRFAAGLNNPSGKIPTTPAAVINMSLAAAVPGPLFTAMQEAVDAVRAAGVIVIAAAGNDASAAVKYPAAANGVVCVSATGRHGERASYSNFGPSVDVAAPGGDLVGGLLTGNEGGPRGILSTAGYYDESTGPESDYRYYVGTSMAAPHVAGVAALMKSVYPGLTPQEFDDLLAAGELTRDIGTAGRDDFYGWGIIDAHKAVLAAQALASAAPPPVIISASPGQLSFGESSTQEYFDISKQGDGEVSMTSITDDQSWLEVSSESTDQHGLGTYKAIVERNELSPGDHIATITIKSSSNTVQIPVRVTVPSPDAVAPEPNNSGPQLVLLLNDEGAIVRQYHAAMSNGEFDFSFNTLESGTYQLVSGSDLDGDGVICEQNDSCVTWKNSTGSPALEVEEGAVVDIGVMTSTSRSDVSDSSPQRSVD